MMNLGFTGAFLLLAPFLSDAGLLPNGGAELGVMYWTNVSPVSSDCFSGRYCFELKVQKKWKAAEPWHPIAVEPGKTYTFSAWVRSTGKPCLVGLLLGFPEQPGRRKVLMKNTTIGNTWTRISGVYRAEPGVKFVKLRIPVWNDAGEGTLLLDDISLNAPETTLKQTEMDHRADLTEDARQGHELDLAYYDAGTRIDNVLFDFDELERQGRQVPAALREEARRAGEELRAEWWKLASEREKYWDDYSRANAANASLLPFREKIAAFAKKASEQAAKVDAASRPSRQGLVYVKREYPRDFWKDQFILAADMEWTHWGEGRLTYPGKHLNPEYEAKAANDLQLNQATLLVNPLPQESRALFIDAFDRYFKAPYLVWSNDDSFNKHDMVNESYFMDRAKLLTDTDAFLAKFRQYPHFTGVQVDEPLMVDARCREPLQPAWKEYLARRRDYLNANGVTEPEKTVEWKIFKNEFLGRHLKFIFDELQKRGQMVSICVMPTYEGSDPARSGWVEACKYLPLAGTDLYRNGSTLEGLHLQLFKNAVPGRAVLLPGAMFSCKTPDNYRRSISNGIVHADGLHMWTNTFFSKYRDANTFWRYGGQRPTLDDRKRSDRFNWYPWGWEIMRERYHYAASHADVLAKRESLADVALLVSERTRFLDKSRRYWNQCLAAYSELVGANVPFDALFLENMTEQRYRRYRLIIAPGMLSLTPAERARLQQYVADGGALVATPDFGSQDEWGRPVQEKPAFGTRFSADDITLGVEEYNVSFTWRFRPEITRELLAAVNQNSRLPYSVTGLPFGVEVQFQKSGTGKMLVQLLDYVGEREVSGHRLRDNRTGKSIPLPPFRIHDMIIRDME